MWIEYAKEKPERGRNLYYYFEVTGVARETLPIVCSISYPPVSC